MVGGCENDRGGTVHVSYQPVFSPVSFSVDSRGDVSFQAETGLVSPIGRFAIGASIKLARDATTVVIRPAGNGYQDAYELRTMDTLTARYKGSGSVRIDPSRHLILIEADYGTVVVERATHGITQTGNSGSEIDSPVAHVDRAVAGVLKRIDDQIPKVGNLADNLWHLRLWQPGSLSVLPPRGAVSNHP